MLREEARTSASEATPSPLWPQLVPAPVLWAALLFIALRPLAEHPAHFDEPWLLRWLRLALGHPLRTWLALVLVTWAWRPPRASESRSGALGTGGNDA